MKYLKIFDTEQDYQDNVQDLDTPNVSLTEDDKKVHYTPYPDSHDDHDYVEIGGVKWATMNIGANSVTDYGLYFQWGDTQGYTADQVGSGEGKKYFSWDDYKWTEDGGSTFTKYNSTDGKVVLESSDDAVTAAWGGNWRTPTKEEFDALISATTNVWVTNYQGSGINGRLFTDETDSSKTLFFPACGKCECGSFDSVGGYGCYWSSSFSIYFADYSRSMNFTNGSMDMYISQRDWGYGVRGVLSEN